jgi:hypothetical protein
LTTSATSSFVSGGNRWQSRHPRQQDREHIQLFVDSRDFGLSRTGTLLLKNASAGSLKASLRRREAGGRQMDVHVDCFGIFDFTSVLSARNPIKPRVTQKGSDQDARA